MELGRVQPTHPGVNSDRIWANAPVACVGTASGAATRQRRSGIAPRHSTTSGQCRASRILLTSGPIGCSAAASATLITSRTGGQRTATSIPLPRMTSEQPERYFDYDLRTHDVIPRDDLVEDERRRAWDTIDDLGLNRVGRPILPPRLDQADCRRHTTTSCRGTSLARCVSWKSAE